MSNQVLEPDVDFIREISRRGGDTLKKCYQCATCSVACPISPDNKPFPRKEMIAASWGLSDRLTADVDVWLCHQCGDCSARCPRGAKPGDVLGAIRSYAIEKYSKPSWLAKAVNDPKKLPTLIGIPVALFIVMGLIVGPILMKILGPILDIFFKKAGDASASTVKLLDFTPELFHGHIAHAQFFSSWLVDMIFVPTMTFAVVVFVLAMRSFVKDMHETAVREGKVANAEFSWIGLAKALPRVVLPILKHEKFTECSENRVRSTSHMMVLYGFIGLFIVTGIFFVVLYGSMLLTGYEEALHGPYNVYWNPVKWLANAAGVCLVIGSLAMIKERLGKDKETMGSAYQDWFLLGLVLALGVTGLGAEMTRLAGAAFFTYVLYFLHLVSVWMLFAYVPFSKLAHLVYRTLAMTYAEYAGREKAC
ncbi:MAG: quinone-interacting membrane-bound oxidoreductase complex subunit QmoC [Deltaproteobacteria bacterium]|nr:quinone-interacting membrane-bound oxidoreductase complex subunit QmoC [Deltaproteobacteria bacterium]